MTNINADRFEEAFALMRLTLERSALVFKVLKDKLSVDEVEKISPPKCIGELKKPFYGIGNFYGMFSGGTHSKLPLSVYYYFYKISKPKATNLTPSKKNLLLFKLFLCVVVEINYAVSEFLGKECFKGIRSWKLSRKGWKYMPPHTDTAKSTRHMLSLDLLYLYGDHVASKNKKEKENGT